MMLNAWIVRHRSNLFLCLVEHECFSVVFQSLPESLKHLCGLNHIELPSLDKAEVMAEEVAKQARQACELAEEMARHACDRAEEMATRARDRAEEMATRARDRAEEMATRARDKAEEVARQARERAEEMARHACEKCEEMARQACDRAEDMARHACETCEAVARHAWTLVHHHHLPKWLRDNEFLTKGHRPQLHSFCACFRSMFRIHTETGNIWTHLLGEKLPSYSVQNTVAVKYGNKLQQSRY